jgi:RES domain
MSRADRPVPPRDIAQRNPPAITIGDVTFYRFYRRGLEPIFFDRSTKCRFNSSDGSFGVLYAAENLAGAFAETFLRNPGRRILPDDLIAQRGRVDFGSRRPLHLVQLYGRHLAALGATAEVVAGAQPYDLPQAWADALHNHPGEFDGIAYRARHDDDEISYALFDRTEAAIEELDRDENLDADWFYELMKHYNIGLIR